MWGDKSVTLLIRPHEHDSSGYLYHDAISDRFFTLDFPSSVFLVKMCLVIVVVLAFFLSHKLGHSSLIPSLYVGIKNRGLTKKCWGRHLETLSYIGYSS